MYSILVHCYTNSVIGGIFAFWFFSFALGSELKGGLGNWRFVITGPSIFVRSTMEEWKRGTHWQSCILSHYGREGVAYSVIKHVLDTILFTRAAVETDRRQV
jgi:hypothetical protein